MIEEVWKELNDYPKYFISSYGNIKSYRRKEVKELKPTIDDHGYLSVTLSKLDKTRSKVRIHKLVALSFIQNPLNKNVVNHIDGVKINNNINNLEWMTIYENVKHAYQTGLMDIRWTTRRNNLKYNFENQKPFESKHVPVLKSKGFFIV